jgi:hypothetical protein
VIKYYPDTDGWFGKDDKGWPVAFHGIEEEGERPALVISNLVIYGFKLGKSQIYESDKCIRTG